jgi:hypothetical protein
METIFAEILGRHTAEVIQRASGLIPKETRIDSRPQNPPLCELAVRIDFKGRLGQSKVGGYVLCGFVRQDQSRPILEAMARHLHLDEGLIDSPDGPINLLNEFLNIVIGLTGAEWAEQGFEMNFSPPVNMSGQAVAALTGAETAFHVVVGTESGARVDLLAVFRG